MPKFKRYSQRIADQQLNDEPIALQLEQATTQLAAATFAAIAKDEWLIGYIFDEAQSQILARASRGDGEFYQLFEDTQQLRLVIHNCTTRRGGDGTLYPVRAGQPVEQRAANLEIAEKSLAYYVKQSVEQGQHTIIEIRSERANIGPLQHLVALVEVNPLQLIRTDRLALIGVGNIEDFRFGATFADMVLKMIEPLPVAIVDSSDVTSYFTNSLQVVEKPDNAVSNERVQAFLEKTVADSRESKGRLIGLETLADGSTKCVYISPKLLEKSGGTGKVVPIPTQIYSEGPSGKGFSTLLNIVADAADNEAAESNSLGGTGRGFKFPDDLEQFLLHAQKFEVQPEIVFKDFESVILADTVKAMLTLTKQNPEALDFWAKQFPEVITDEVKSLIESGEELMVLFEGGQPIAWHWKGVHHLVTIGVEGKGKTLRLPAEFFSALANPNTWLIDPHNVADYEQQSEGAQG